MTTFLDRAFKFWDGTRWWPDDPGTPSEPSTSASPFWNDPIASHEQAQLPTVTSTITTLSASPKTIHNPNQDTGSGSTTTLTATVKTSPTGTAVTTGTVQFKTTTGVLLGGAVGYTAGVGWRLTLTSSSNPRSPTGTTSYQAVYNGVTGTFTGSTSNSVTVTVQTVHTGSKSGVGLVANWVRSYQGNGALRTYRQTEGFYGWQTSGGVIDSSAGDMRAIILFPVPADVKNCYSVDSVTLQFYNVGGGIATGVTCYVGTHQATSVPADYNSIPGKNPRLQSFKVNRYGRFYSGLSIGAFGAAFKAGAKGIMLGPSGVAASPSSTALAYAGYCELNYANPYYSGAPAEPASTYACTLWISYRIWA